LEIPVLNQLATSIPGKTQYNKNICLATGTATKIPTRTSTIFQVHLSIENSCFEPVGHQHTKKSSIQQKYGFGHWDSNKNPHQDIYHISDTPFHTVSDVCIRI
jgi:hypothetical protein